MNVIDICQEAINTGFISVELAQKLDHILWHCQLSEVELATIDYVSRRIESGKITVNRKSSVLMSHQFRAVN